MAHIAQTPPPAASWSNARLLVTALGNVGIPAQVGRFSDLGISLVLVGGLPHVTVWVQPSEHGWLLAWRPRTGFGQEVWETVPSSDMATAVQMIAAARREAQGAQTQAGRAQTQAPHVQAAREHGTTVQIRQSAPRRSAVSSLAPRWRRGPHGTFAAPPSSHAA